MDHSFTCLLCRQDLLDYFYFQDHPCHKLVLPFRKYASAVTVCNIFANGALVLNGFQTLYHERGAMIEAEERDARLDTPILTAGLGFPGMPTMCHLFEPRCAIISVIYAYTHPSYLYSVLDTLSYYVVA